ncbi:MAG TPA: PCMD domain-containing protein [Bacteroidia bacterium]|nr:PCMD domain-containing protein [Bacteroidia bacterium]
MKKFTILLFSFITFITELQAQNPLPNASFENWSNFGIYEDPDNWNTLNSSTAVLGVLTCLKATGADTHSGTNAIKLTTKNVIGQNANGIATTGTINTSTQTISGGIAYTGRPDSIAGWYKYTSVGGDNGFVAFVLLDASNDTIGFANFTTPAATVSNYTYFSMAINYFNSGTPTLSRCLLSSSAGFTAVINSTMFIDDLRLISNSTDLKEDPAYVENMVHYSASSGTIALHSPSGNIKKIELLDISGKYLTAYNVFSQKAEFELPQLAAGIYIIMLYDFNNQPRLTKKIMVE